MPLLYASQPRTAHSFQFTPPAETRTSEEHQYGAPDEVYTRPPSHGSMATATAPHFGANGGLNGAAKLNATRRYTPHRVADDDDSIATEQFPEFDPSHDGSEDEVNGGDNYTHTAGSDDGDDGRNATHATTNGYGHGSGSREGDLSAESHDDADDEEDQERQEHHRLSPVEPLPEQEHHEEPAPEPREETTPTRTSPVTSPPYWRHSYANDDRASSLSRAHHDRSNFSTESLVPGGITLQDNEADSDTEPALSSPGRDHRHHSEHHQQQQQETRTSYGRDRNKACWARSVEVTDHVIVNGSATNIGAFVVWNIRVQTLSGPYMNIRKRYSEFDDFRRALIETFPAFEAAVPVLPPKSVISRFRPRFLEKRRAGLQYFLK